jgi:hypothetical protein
MNERITIRAKNFSDIEDELTPPRSRPSGGIGSGPR